MRVFSQDCCTNKGSEAEQRRAGHYDRVGHASVQPWSAGPLFPAVIATVERYAEFPSYTQWLDSEGRRSAPLSAYPRGSYQHWQEEQAAFYESRTLAERLESVSHALMLDGVTEEYALREDAEHAAELLLAHPEYRAARKAEGAEVGQ